MASAVAHSYRKRSGQATGWPLVSWIGRLRADPLTRLGLGPKRRGDDPDVHRTSMPLLSAGAQARMSMAVRTFTDETVSSVSAPWRAAARTTAEQTLDALLSTLDLAIARTPLPAKGSWWWVLVGIVQWIAVVAGLGGALWLVGAALLPTFGLPAFPLPAVDEGPLEGWAIPTLLLIAAVLIGILLGLISAVLSALTAGGRRHRARRRLLAAVDEVVQQDVAAPVGAALDQARAVSAALQIARR